jgi:hypothetical protein
MLETVARTLAKLSPSEKMPPTAWRSFPKLGQHQKRLGGAFRGSENTKNGLAELSEARKTPKNAQRHFPKLGQHQKTAQWHFPKLGSLARTPIHRIPIAEIYANPENPNIGGIGVQTKRQQMFHAKP